MTMLDIFHAGDQIGGYCNGFFGRDDYENKTCVMVTGKYAVFQYEDGTAVVLNITDSLIDSYKNGYLEQWFLDYETY